MRIGMPINYARDFHQTVEGLREYEEGGLDVVFLPEAYTFDAVSQLGYIAAKTSTLRLCSSILNIYSRTPTLLAMTAAGLDYVSGGRFMMGIGASGPQVIEGFHGLRHDAPLARTREVVEICHQVWRREPVEFHGTYHDIPLSTEKGGSGLGKPLKLINHPVRDRIPVMLAALGPKNVELAAELFDGWEPLFYFPERAGEAFADALRAGRSKRSAELPPLDVIVDAKVLISEDDAELAAGRQQVREHLALYIGGMGAKGKNFYNDLAGRFGFTDAAAEVQELFLAGRRKAAAAAVPRRLVDGVALVGAPGWVAERLAAFAESGVTTLNATPLAATHQRRVEDITALRRYVG
ncbi:LLM class F420-dependent oxidoreductase [Streptosporangium sp. NPDC002607]